MPEIIDTATHLKIVFLIRSFLLVMLTENSSLRPTLYFVGSKRGLQMELFLSIGIGSCSITSPSLQQQF